MSYADFDDAGSLRERLRARLGQRATGLVVALLLETLLVLMLLTLSQSTDPPKPEPTLVTSFDAGAEPEAEPEPPQDTRQDPSAPPIPQPVEPPPEPQAVEPPPPSPIPLRRDQPRGFDLSRVAPTPTRPPPRQPAYGPAAPTNLPRDSERVGTMPNGEPLYRAEWYREPTEEMMDDYLSTAQGPGYGLIACRTVPEWRVVDCVPLEEYPTSAGINRAVLAAAWEFQVRPARLKGRYLYGTWVRIRIDYTIKRQQPQF